MTPQNGKLYDCSPGMLPNKRQRGVFDPCLTSSLVDRCKCQLLRIFTVLTLFTELILIYVVISCVEYVQSFRIPVIRHVTVPISPFCVVLVLIIRVENTIVIYDS